ncbi:acylneuraminate cytidylyltransferase family protein [Pedobacter sp. KBW06]|uniref:acylneuraminate cytidylyltransferase family protein n=1 Tax=Pedobacter sp. KBW06 TaxID=2153359 RepID=UPI000F58F76A|nr:acylneuraminate cytidylyltransferase family protein [Pedobacter sp. KBW06]RQO67578.1 acylneuraminate cytidylyltransferase family protein [Pedobacter sp. KBW06]
MKTLYIIPARGGSKGIPKKNIKLLAGKPLIQYSIDRVREVADESNICVSTDSDEIIEVVNNYNLEVPFKRPEYLSDDKSGTYEVLLHALDFYKQKNVFYDTVMIVQPTSPFRLRNHFLEVLDLYHENLDMVVSVGKSHQNPYFTLFEENKDGLLEKSKDGDYKTRQECPPVYFYNGSLYLINVNSLYQSPIHQFKRVRKYLMEEKYSVDIDTPLDWSICETMISQGYINF